MNIWLSEIWQAWRASLRKPGFLLLAAGVLALGIGSTVAVFTLIDNVLLKPLPYAQPAQLVSIGRQLDGRYVSPRQYQHFSSLPGVASVGLAAGRQVPVNVTGGGKPEQVMSLGVDRHLLPTLGVKMLLGRNFTAAEDAPHGPRAVILSHGFWQRRFGGRTDVLGQAMSLEGHSSTIVGVLPRTFHLEGGADILLPTALPAHSQDDGTNYIAVARMAPGATLGALSAAVNTRLHAMYAAMGDKAQAEYRHVIYDAVPLAAALHQGSRRLLALFLACALFVLLVALVNLVNLMILRALARGHGLAVRAALGASSLRLALPGLAEGLLIGLVGAVAGVGLAVLGLTLFGSFMPPQWASANGWHFGLAVWVVALGIGVAGALLSAGLGWWRGNAATAMSELREGGRTGMDRRSGLLSKALVVTQVALTTILLFGAGQFLNTLYDAAHTPLGFNSRGVATFDLAPVKAMYPDASSVQRLTRQVLQQLREQPGVEAATAGTNLPVGGQLNLPMHVPGGSDIVAVQYRGVSPGFFATYGIPVRAGRGFARTDSHGAQAVAVVNQAFARKWFHGRALGKSVHMVVGDTQARIVGVVGDTRQHGPLGSAPAILYVPLAQVPDKVMGVIRSFMPLHFGVRVRGAAAASRGLIENAVHQVAPAQPIANIGSLADIARGTTYATRLNLTLIGVFSLLTLALAAAGLYAVMAVAVNAREREFGVRMALGAAPARLARLVVRSGLWQVLAGLAIGVAAGGGLTLAMHDTIEQVATIHFDANVILGVCIVLTLAGLLA
ncbi:MAG TPA: ABC transporter permease, partial [Rhodanobacteraceae bacterium]